MKYSYEKTILITGAGGGIGFEAAKAFADMGAKVIIVDIDKDKGVKAAHHINIEYPDAATFYHTDLSKEVQVKELCDDIIASFGCPDAIFNNATMVSLGNIENVSITDWDESYAVNLKAPILFISYFLPFMRKKNTGCFIFVSSSGAAPYMGAYEVFKTAQVELSNTLALELADTDIYSYTIGPGLVKTETAKKSIEVIASQMGMSTEDFYSMNNSHIIEAKEAGFGFALSVLNAKKYHGQEISSIQVLNDFNYYNNPTDDVFIFDKELLLKIITTYQEQYDGWKKMNIFERQWVLRDFKKYMGVSADSVFNDFQKLKAVTTDSDPLDGTYQELFEKLKTYWKRQLQLLKGYEKNPIQLTEKSRIVASWIDDIDTMLS